MPPQYPRELVTALIENGELSLGVAEREAALTLVDTIFFASLMIEEGDPVRVAIVHHPNGAAGLANVQDSDDETPIAAWDVTAITRRDFDAPTLAKLARGLQFGVQLVVVGGVGASLWIDGVARKRPRTDGGDVTRIAAPRPGALVFEHHNDQILRYEAGQRLAPAINVVAERGPARLAIGAIIDGKHPANTGATRLDGQTFYSYPELALRQLIKQTRATGSGAILALYPIDPPEAVLAAIRYRRLDAQLFPARIREEMNRGLRALSRRAFHHGENLTAEQVRARDTAQSEADVAAEELSAAIDDVAQLSAIDGAVVLGPKLAVFGAGYLMPSMEVPAGAVMRAHDAAATKVEPYPPRHGARHKAGFSFAYHNPGAVAFIVSEDGPVSCAVRVGEQVLVWSVEVLET